MKRIISFILVVLASSLLLPNAYAVTITDGDFTSWSSFSFIVDDPLFAPPGPGTSAATVGTATTGGNPGAYLQATFTVAAGDTMWGGGIKTDYTYSPASSGAITSLSIGADVQMPVAGASAWQLVVQQNGRRYYSVPLGAFSGSGWSRVTASNLQATDFDTNPWAKTSGIPLDGNRPDFSATGAPMQFGFLIGNVFRASGTVTVPHGLDNFSVAIGEPPPPTPLPFFDDFNRADGAVGNGWLSTTGNVGGDLVIRGNALSTPGANGTAGIYRPIDFSAPVTVSATLTQENGFGGLLNRYDVGFLFGSNGSRTSGYGVFFTRGDQNYADSAVLLTLNGAQLARLPSTFQYGTAITPTVTLDPADGSIAGSVSGDGNTFPFNFGPRTVTLPGSNFAVVQGFPDGRSSVITNPTVDDLSLAHARSKRPVVIVPGIMGTTLHRAEDDAQIWVSPSLLGGPYDSVLFPLLLQTDGMTPDTRRRCAGSKNVCSVDADCPNAANGDFCVLAGGAPMVPGSLLDTFRFHAYDNLAKFLQEKGGYTPGTTLFTFPYDWRLDLWSQAEKFRETLDRSFSNPDSRIDVIAHSMGGLLVRAFLQRYPGDQRIASVIYLGTPQRGAPLSYAKLIGAASLVNHINGGFPLLNLETETFLMQNFPSAYALLPRSSFILVTANNRTVLEPLQESFARLSNRDLVARANELHDVQLAGPDRVPRSRGVNGTMRRTLTGLDYRGSCPKPLSDPTGDGTVPTLSSTAFLNPSAYLFVKESHADLPGNPDVMSQILNMLRGQDAPGANMLTSPVAARDAWRLYSCSPILVRVTDEAGKTNGLDADGKVHEEIPDSSHYRFAENEGGFLPFDKTYTVHIVATDHGLFTLGFDHLSSPNDSIANSIIFTEIPISTRTRARLTLNPTNATPNLEVDIDDDGAVDFIVPPNEPPAAIMFPFVLTNVIQNMRLHEGISKSLIAKLAAASDSIRRGNTQAAQGQLGGFLNEVRAQRGKALTDAQAGKLIAMAARAVSALNSPN